MRKKIEELRKRTGVTFTIVSRIFGLVWQMDKRVFVLTFFTASFPAILPYANAYIYKLVIDTVIAGIEGGTMDMQYLTWLLAARIASYFIQDAVYSTQSFIDQMLWSRMPFLIERLLYESIARLDISQLEDPEFHDKLEKAKGSTYRPRSIVSDVVYTMQSVLQLVIGFGAIITLNWVLVPFVIILTLPEFIYRFYETKNEFSLWNWQSPLKRRSGYLSWLLQHIPSLKEIRIFGLTSVFANEGKRLQEKFYRGHLKLSRRSYFFRLLFNFFSTLLFIGMEIYVIVLAIARQVTIGDIGFYTSVVNGFQNGLGGFLRNVGSVFEDSLYVQSLFDVIDAQPQMIQASRPRPMTGMRPPRIVFDHVSFRYPTGQKNILEDISLTIEPGEKIALVGENGAGKSTLIKLLARFYDPTEGKILVDGHDLREYSVKEWHKRIGVLFQDFNHYEDTVRKNIYYGNVGRGLDLRNIKKAASDGGAVPVINDLKDKYDQMLGKDFAEGVELSAGQWQKVALSRAYFRNAPLIILDEPTSSIDAKAEYEIFQRVDKLSKDKSVILISHRFSTVRRADKIFVIDDGKVTEEGSHAELLAKDGLYAQLFKLQAAGYQ